MDEQTKRTDTYCIDCTGDAVVGDKVRFDEAVFGGSHRRPNFLGLRTIEAEITADSYGAAKQQHTFSMTVIASEGYDPIEPGTKIRRKGRNVYRRTTWRVPWDDESAREEVAEEKHARGDDARIARGVWKAAYDGF